MCWLLGILVCYAGLLASPWLASLLAEGAQWFADFDWRVGVLVCQLVCMLADCLARTEHPMSMTDTAGTE